VLWLNGTYYKKNYLNKYGKLCCYLTTLCYKVRPARTPLFPSNGSSDCTPNTCIVNCDQTASVSSIATIDSLYILINALPDSTIADPCSSKIGVLTPKNVHGTLQQNNISTMVTIIRHLQMPYLMTPLLASPSLKQGHWTNPSPKCLHCQLQPVGQTTDSEMVICFLSTINDGLISIKFWKLMDPKKFQLVESRQEKQQWW